MWCNMLKKLEYFFLKLYLKQKMKQKPYYAYDRIINMFNKTNYKKAEIIFVDNIPIDIIEVEKKPKDKSKLYIL